MEYRFDIALSFAGDGKRNTVRLVAEILRNSLGVGRVFFDEWFEAEIVGMDAQIVLQHIYRNHSFMVVVCVCERYNEKPWTQDEWRAILSLERQLRDANSSNAARLRFVPIRFGDGAVDGLFDTAIVKDMRDLSPVQIAAFLLRRLALARSREHLIDAKDAVTLPSVIDAEAEEALSAKYRNDPETIIPHLCQRIEQCADGTERYWIYILLRQFNSELANEVLKTFKDDPDPFARSAFS